MSTLPVEVATPSVEPVARQIILHAPYFGRDDVWHMYAVAVERTGFHSTPKPGAKGEVYLNQQVHYINTTSINQWTPDELTARRSELVKVLHRLAGWNPDDEYDIKTDGNDDPPPSLFDAIAQATA